MAGNLKKNLLIFALALLLPLAGVGFGLIPISLFWAKPALSQVARDYLGMDLNIGGPLRLRLGSSPSLSATEITLHNPAEGGRFLVHLDQLVVKPRLLAI
jgi:uncharacterized protein involved in outer membrane biogenesis